MKHINIILTTILLILSLHARAENSIELIHLQNRSAESLIPILKPMLAQGDQVSGNGYVLLVKTDPNSLDKLKQIIESLDQPVKTFMISVRYDDMETNLRSQLLNTGHRNSIQHSTSQLRVSEGEEAFISSGSRIPMVNTTIASTRRYGADRATSIQIQDVSSGFSVVPKYLNNQVLLTIKQKTQALARDNSYAIANQQLDSTMTVPLGQWVQLGGINTEQMNSQNVIISTENKNQVANNLWIKVDLTF